MRDLRRVLAVAGLLVTAPTAVRAETLEEVLTAAYRNSPQLASRRDQLRAINERVPQALAGTRPTITFNGTTRDVKEKSNGPL